MNELARVAFYGGEIEAVKIDDDIWVSVRRACEHLGIDNAGQQVKLKEKEWARIEIISTRDARGYRQDAFMIHVDSLPMWMVTISTNKVAKRVRPLLIAYQKEAADVLRDYFFTGIRKCPTHIEALRGWADAMERAQLAESKIKEMTPDAKYGKALSYARGNRLIGTFAKAVVIDDRALGQNKMFEILRNAKLLIPTLGSRFNLPYQKYVDAGYFRVKTGQRMDKNGNMVNTSTPVITPKGERFIVSMLADSAEFRHKSIRVDGVRVDKQLKMF